MGRNITYPFPYYSCNTDYTRKDVQDKTDVVISFLKDNYKCLNIQIICFPSFKYDIQTRLRIIQRKQNYVLERVDNNRELYS